MLGYRPHTEHYACILTLLVCAVLPGGKARAGGWPQAVGHGEVITVLTWTKADEAYDVTGQKLPRSTYRKLEIAPYAEYGLTESLTLIGEVAYTRDRTDYYGFRFVDEDFSHIKAGARLALGTWDKTLFSLQPIVTAHLMRRGNDTAATTRGDFDTELGLVLARSEKAYGFELFSVQEIAWRYRDRGRPDEVRVDITMGAKLWPGAMLLAKSLNTATVKPSATGETYQSAKAALSFVHDLPQDLMPGWALEAGIEQTLYGRNIAHETGGRIGLWYRF